MHGARSEAGYYQCRSQHRVGNTPAIVSTEPTQQNAMRVIETNPHRRVERPCDFIVLLESGAASQDLRQPELTDCTFHVANLSLWWRGCSGPL